MKVVLIKDIPKLGRRGDTLTVSDGYARNFLLPGDLAVAVGDIRSKKVLVTIQSQRKTAKQLRDKSEALMARLESHTFVFSRPATEQGSLYAAVSPADIAASISNYLGISVGAHSITVPAAIKHIGQHAAICRLAGKDVQCKLSVTILTQ